MDGRLEELFRLCEEYDLEVEKALKTELSKRFRSEVNRFLKENRPPMTEWDFIHATADGYKHWRRNKH